MFDTSSLSCLPKPTVPVTFCNCTLSYKHKQVTHIVINTHIVFSVSSMTLVPAAEAGAHLKNLLPHPDPPLLLLLLLLLLLRSSVPI